MKIEVETNAVVQTTHALVEALKKAERAIDIALSLLGTGTPEPDDRRVGISVDPR
jgi:hypothetical protein